MVPWEFFYDPLIEKGETQPQFADAFVWYSKGSRPAIHEDEVWLATDPNRSVPLHVHGEWVLDLGVGWVNFSKEAECQGRQARFGPWPMLPTGPAVGVPLVMHLGFVGSEPTKEERFLLVVGNRSVCQREMGDTDHGGQVWNLSGDLCGSLVMKDSERG